MGEFGYYTWTQLGFICLGSTISVLGIMYKLCKLENSDLVEENETKVDDEFTQGKDTKSFEEIVDILKSQRDSFENN